MHTYMYVQYSTFLKLLLLLPFDSTPVPSDLGRKTGELKPGRETQPETIYCISSKNSALLIIRHPLPND